MSITGLKSPHAVQNGLSCFIVEQGRFVRPALAKHMRVFISATFRLWVMSGILAFDLLPFRASMDYDALFQESAGSMQLFMWHGTRRLCLAAFQPSSMRLRTRTQIRPHNPCWLNGRREFLCLSVCQLTAFRILFWCGISDYRY